MRLSAPLRVVWDWDWPPIVRPEAGSRRPDPHLVRAVAARIREARVLLLEIGYPCAEALAAGEVAAALHGFAGSATLVLSPRVLGEAGGEASLQGLGVDEVWVDRTPLAPGGPGGMTPGDFAEARMHPLAGVRVYLTSGNIEAAARVVAAAAEGGVSRFSLPNLPLFGEVLRTARESAPAARDVREFARLLEPVLRAHPALDLRVHHYGIAGALAGSSSPAAAAEAPGAAGCQAGAALAYIDPEGILHPCASLPVPLARVADEGLSAAWSGGAVAALREGLGRLPGPCRGCPAESSCRGGCRGWAHYLSGGWDAPGPDCTRA